jgi:hypothetical protein
LGSSVEFAGIISTSLIAVLIYFKDAVNEQIVKQISRSDHTTIFGLGKMSSALLHNEAKLGRTNYIIFERQVANDQIEFFRKVGMGVVEGNAFEEEYLERLNFNTMANVMISLGNDRLNIELATKLIDYYRSKKIKTPLRMAIQIINPGLNALFHQSLINQEDNISTQIELQSFSFYAEVAESFFDYNYIDGQDRTIIESNEDYHVAVVGNGELACNIVAQAAKVAHLPNENRLTIHLIDREAQQVKYRLIKRYPGLENILDLTPHELDDHKIDFFSNDIWQQSNLTHIFICYDDESKNLELAVDIVNKTYLSDIIDDLLQTHINVAIFNSDKLSEKIDTNQKTFNQFSSFGDVHKICTRENIIDKNDHRIAKLVNFQYTPNALHDLKDQEVLEAIDDKWFNKSRYSDKLSSIAQSKHIYIKLKALGLKMVKSDLPPQELLQPNRKHLDETLQVDRDQLKLTDEFLNNYAQELPKLWGSEEDQKSIDIKYFPQVYSTMLEKLIRAEHNRWNAFHYLHGWQYGQVKNKKKKVHTCLLPLNQFKDPLLQLTVIYDMYAILYIPNYLANTGYQIIPLIDEDHSE